MKAPKMWFRWCPIGLSLALSVAQAAPAAAADPCAGYAGSKRIGRLGGPNRFAGAVKTLDDLRQALTELEPDIRYVLDTKGLAHVTRPLYEAIQSGRGVSERKLAPGEKFEWMALRKRGEPQVADGLCVATSAAYDAFIVEVPVITEQEAAAAPACDLTAERVGEDPCRKTLRVDATRSSPAVKVIMSGPEGEQTIIESGSTRRTWEGEDSDPYRASYGFKAVGEVRGRGMATGTTYTFVIPKICLNVALVGSAPLETQGPEEVKRCEKSVTVDPLTPTTPAVSVAASPAEVCGKQDVSVSVSGTSVPCQGQEPFATEIVDHKGNQVTDPALAPPFPATLRFRKWGEYTVRATAVNEVGQTANAETKVTVKPVWRVRGSVALVEPDTETFSTSSERSDGVQARTNINLDSGEGVGLSGERLFCNRIGLEFGVLWAQLDANVQLDLGELWDMTTDDVGTLTLFVGPNFHLTRDPSRVDFYLGPFVTYVQYEDVTVTLLGESVKTNIDDDFGFGGQLGLDIPFGQWSPWGFHLGAMWLDSQAEGDLIKVDANPLIYKAGLVYKF